MSGATSTSTVTAVWGPCPMCWAQGRIYEDRNGEGLVPSPCGSCLGIGERLVEATPPGQVVPHRYATPSLGR